MHVLKAATDVELHKIDQGVLKRSPVWRLGTATIMTWRADRGRGAGGLVGSEEQNELI